MSQNVNYITHLNAVFESFVNDERLSPFHISLYFSLFQYWNISKFRNPISINREEMMRASKIGSANTYTKCLKELHQWNYINYIPSHSPLVGSKIHLYTFNKSTGKTSNKTVNNASDISADKSHHQTPAKVVRPSKNKLNKTNKQNNSNSHESKRTKNSRKSSDSSGGRIKKEKKVAPKKVEAKAPNPERKHRGKKFVISSEVERPTLKQIKTHFTAKQWPSIEAEKFFNYFQSNGWLVGGKTPMKNWKAAAHNWILNSATFHYNTVKSKKATPGVLHSTTEKNYGEPL